MFLKVDGIIPSMIFKNSFLKRTLLLVLALQLAGLTPCMAPKAQALFWEDQGDDSNDPKETKSRPDHFFLFDWVDDLNKDAKKNHYKDMDNHDKGQSVNNDARTLVIVGSGIVGLGMGLFLANRISNGSSSQTADMFIGGALGLGAGILVGALIMPADYDVDQRAQSDFLKQRQAWNQDPLRMQIAQAFHPAPMELTLSF